MEHGTRSMHNNSGCRCELCKKANTDYFRARRQANPEKFNAYHRTRKNARHGLTDEQFDDLAKDGCHVCGSHDYLSIDHDHTCCPGVYSCGKCVRGLLCRNHNLALGKCNDSIEELQALIEYLTRWGEGR